MISNKNAQPTILVIFGATGDLVRKKIFPSLYYLYQQDNLPERFSVLGISRKEHTGEEYREFISGILMKSGLVKGGKSKLKEFLKLFYYQSGDFNLSETYEVLNAKVKQIDDIWKQCSNKLFYLAVTPESTDAVVKKLSSSGLSDPCGGPEGWARVIVEKPIGLDGASAKKLAKTLSIFKESQVYLIDHYLGKEMVQGILNFRFSNNLLEHNWNNKHIESIEMRLLEKISIENRGAFYETVGALRDVGQNHLLEILALLTMDVPGVMNIDSIRHSRAEALDNLPKLSQKNIKEDTFRAQYKGYRDVKGVKKNSGVETYFKVNFNLKGKRWNGVKVSIESGKCMKEVDKKIVVNFKHPNPCWCVSGKHENNKVVFMLHPEQGIQIDFLAKKPGLKKDIEKREFDFMLYKGGSQIRYVEEYAKLLSDCIEGDQTWFVLPEEIRHCWSFVDPIVNAWKDKKTKLHFYKKFDTGINILADKTLLEHSPKNITKEIGIIGLGKMGGNLARHMMNEGWRVVGYNRSADSTKELESEGLVGAYSLEQFVQKMKSKNKIVWLMLPAGDAVDNTLFGRKGLVGMLGKNDTIVDGGNSFYKDTIKRYKKVKVKGVHYMDCGVSGGPEGALRGACLMVGGEKRDYDRLEFLFYSMAGVNSVQFFKGEGAGHFVKMVHNGIEYGMMQAIAEGFTILGKSKYKLDLSKVADIYNNGSVIKSRLISWLKEAFDIYGQDLDKISGKVSHSGEGEWTIKTAKELKVKNRVIEEAFKFRLDSQHNPNFTGKVVSAMRGQFGGHPVLKKDSKNRKK